MILLSSFLASANGMRCAVIETGRIPFVVWAAIPVLADSPPQSPPKGGRLDGNRGYPPHSLSVTIHPLGYPMSRPFDYCHVGDGRQPVKQLRFGALFILFFAPIAVLSRFRGLESSLQVGFAADEPAKALTPVSSDINSEGAKCRIHRSRLWQINRLTPHRPTGGGCLPAVGAHSPGPWHRRCPCAGRLPPGSRCVCSPWQ